MKQEIKATNARKSRANDEEVEPGSGNVFADLGFRDAEERLLKAKLATTVLLDAEAYSSLSNRSVAAANLRRSPAPPLLAIGAVSGRA